MTVTEKPRNAWGRLSLAGQFALAGGLVVLVAALAIGYWVSRRIEDSVVRNTANATALYMESFIAPLIQDLATSDTIAPEDAAAISRLLHDTPLGSRVVSFKIWVKGARIVAASDADIVGKSFPGSADLRLAWAGQVVGSFDRLDEDENVAEAAMGVPLLQIYAPIRARQSGEIIAIAEFYEVATQLKADLTRARTTSWLGVFLVMMAIGGSLFAIVLRGSRVIDRQLVDLGEMAARNAALRLKAQGAAARFAEINDQGLRRVGADLHDGPAQLIGFAALRLDALRRHAPGAAAQRDIGEIEKALREAMQDIRNISRGVSFPDIDRQTLPDVIQKLVEAHAERTHGEVSLTSTLAPNRDLPIAAKICIGRVVQEGLTNAWRHGDGVAQEVSVVEADGTLTVSVRDGGPGLPPSQGEGSFGLGLAGLAGRVDSLGGHLTLRDRRDGKPGAELLVVLDLRSIE
jgi:signal transduction histidine kinase